MILDDLEHFVLQSGLQPAIWGNGHIGTRRDIDRVRALLEPARGHALVAVFGEDQPLATQRLAAQQVALGIGAMPHHAALRGLLDGAAELVDGGIDRVTADAGFGG